MEHLDNLLPESFLHLVLRRFERMPQDHKAFQTKILKLLGDKHRLARLRSTLTGTFRERFLDVALSDPFFALLATSIAEFKRNLLHDDILALALYTEEACREILAERELYQQLSLTELTTVLMHYPDTTRILLEVANQQGVVLHPTTLIPVAHSKQVIRENLMANMSLLDTHQDALLMFVQN